jgi:uncharacterized protein (DUF2141 family)
MSVTPSALASSRRRAPAVAMEALEGRKMLALVGGVDPYAMGKGDWVFQISAAMSNTGTKTVPELMTYFKNKGLKWIVVKAGDGNSGPVTGNWKQFGKTLVTEAHKAGLKVFGYHFTYGGVTPNAKNAQTTLAGEKKVATEIMSFNPDGLIIDAEGDWEKNPNANRDAEDYAKTFKQKYPNKLLGHAPFAYVRFHQKFPYLGFGKWADVVMPQLYWKTISMAGTPDQILADVNQDWKDLYNQFLKDGNAQAIKPLVPIGQGSDASATKKTPGTEITRFFDLLRNDPDPASPFGWNGASFWSVQHHTASIWDALGKGTINAPTGSIAGQVFHDADGDGARDVNEAALSGRIVYDDTNNNGKRDGHEPFATTNASGNYLIPHRGPGVHHVRLEAVTGWRQTTPSNSLSQTVTLAASEKATGRNFGATQLSRIVGTVYNDKNADGLKQSGETALSGWTVFVDTDRDGVLDGNEPRSITDAKGNYYLTLAAGSYQIRQITGKGYRLTAPGAGFHEVNLGAGQEVGRLFGNTTLTVISGYVFNDLDKDGIKDANEQGLAGWRVFNDADGDGFWDEGAEIGVLTDRSGRYRFNQLPAGTHRIQVFQPKNWAPTVPGSGSRKITLASGGTTSNKNFGEIKTA